ncbi:hypothetical protein Tco_1406612 [Tanacetum coccineum]
MESSSSNSEESELQPESKDMLSLCSIIGEKIIKLEKTLAKRTKENSNLLMKIDNLEYVDMSKALDAGLVNTESSETESRKQDTSSKSRNDIEADDADIRPIYDEELMAEVQLTANNNVFAIGTQYSEQLEFNNEGGIDQNAKQCHDIRQHGQILNETSNKAKLKKEIDAFETINIELEHSVAKLLTENELLNKEKETFKNHYKNLYDSIKITRAKTIEQTTSLITQNAHLKAKIQEKVFAITALKNELRKSKGNSVDTKFAKPSVLGKLVLHPLVNQSVVRQPTTFKSERPKSTKPHFASQVDVNNDLSKPITRHYLPKERESVFAKPHHVIASSDSRNSSKNMPSFSSNDMVHNHYL